MPIPSQKQRIMKVLEEHYEERVPMPEFVTTWRKFIANHTARISQLRQELRQLKLEIICNSRRKEGIRHTFYMLKPKKSNAYRKALPEVKGR